MLIYLASPYTASSSFERFERYIEAMKATRWLIEEGHSAFSPIVHCHEMAKLFEMPTDAKFWEAYNCGFLRHVETLYVLCISGWNESVGIKHEISFAEALGKPIHKLVKAQDGYATHIY